MELKISEMFKSIQGEGVNVGKEELFIRFHGCNLNCEWCDTKYAQDKTKVRKRSVEEIKNFYKRSNVNRVTLTGGEPMIQDSEVLKRLVTDLRSVKKSIISVETNGTIAPIEKEIFDFYSISPKMESSGNKIQKEELKTFIQCICGKDFQIKFVIADYNDMMEVEDYLKDVDIKEAIAKNCVHSDFEIVFQPEYNSINLKQLYRLYDAQFRDSPVIGSFPYEEVRIIPQVHKMGELQ